MGSFGFRAPVPKALRFLGQFLSFRTSRSFMNTGGVERLTGCNGRVIVRGVRSQIFFIAPLGI